MRREEYFTKFVILETYIYFLKLFLFIYAQSPLSVANPKRDFRECKIL